MIYDFRFMIGGVKFILCLQNYSVYGESNFFSDKKDDSFNTSSNLPT
jgi:hypothetical protein